MNALKLRSSPVIVDYTERERDRDQGKHSGKGEDRLYEGSEEEKRKIAKSNKSSYLSARSSKTREKDQTRVVQGLGPGDGIKLPFPTGHPPSSFMAGSGSAEAPTGMEGNGKVLESGANVTKVAYQEWVQDAGTSENNDHNTSEPKPEEGRVETAQNGVTMMGREGGGTTATRSGREGEETVPQTRPATALALAVDTYCNRERRHKDRERSGEVRALYVTNDGSPDSGKFLIGLKNVFSKCLPNMPKTYITKLVFDRRHRSVVMVRNGKKVIGGITYRPFHERRFAEIAFCAIAQTLQVSGFGTRLMNWTKHWAREKDGCEYFLTYADNAAVGYFSKQGFTKAIMMPKERWHGYIKDYDGGTLMECYIHPTLPHAELPEMIEAQRKALDSVVRQYSTANVVYPGIDRWKDGAMSAMNVEDVPGVKEAGWSESVASSSRPTFEIILDGQKLPSSPDNLQRLMARLMDELIEQKDLVWPFLEPVDAEEVPDYYDIILDPMDISTVQKRLSSKEYYTTIDIFAADVARIFDNAKKYNDASTVYYQNAEHLLQMFRDSMHRAVVYQVPDAEASE